jgi:cytochrome c553
VRAVPILLVLACQTAPAPGSEDLGTWHWVLDRGPPEQPDRTKQRRHMRQRRADLRDLERALLDGHLEEGKLFAFAIAHDARDSEALRAAATAVAESGSLEQASRLVPRVAVACSGCHASSPLTADASSPPIDEPTPVSRRMRHRWATERAREALISGRIGPWRDALDVFRMSAMDTPDRDTLRLQLLANRAIAADLDTNDDRARRYGEMLVTCVRCHSKARR